MKSVNKATSKIAIVIPARLHSSRLPNKVLLNIAGLPMVEHVRRRGVMNNHSVPVFVASGDDEVLNQVKGFGGQTIKTYREHSDGLSRVNEAASNLDFEHYIILQGDEILALPADIDALIQAICDSPQFPIWNQISPIKDSRELEDVSVVKCMEDQDGQIFSLFRRSPLTSDISLQIKLIKKVCGLFAISANCLEQICQKENTKFQTAESIEQLKFLEYGYKIKSITSEFGFPSVNVAEDVQKVVKILDESQLQSKVLRDVTSFTS
jgi:3-deoxy-manno-octulosonate cytidylyltransferase (CMP-KDO synthetase)